MRSDVAVRCGAELADLAETYYVRVYRLAVDVVLVTVAVALLLTPLSRGASGPGFTLIALGAIATAGVVARLRVADSYLWLRAKGTASLVGASAVATALLIDDPVTSALWWVAPSILSICAITSDRRTLATCALVLTIGWVLGIVWHDHLPQLLDDPRLVLQGATFGFWAVLIAATIDGAASYMLRLGQDVAEVSPPPRRVNARVFPRGGSAVKTEAVVATGSATATTDQTSKLTGRQLEVLVLLCDGLKQHEIAQALGVSVRQIERHVRDAKDRLDARSTAELVAAALAAGLVAPRPASTAA
jgi:DNA-binding CsgD family transcriptional regulator